MTDLIEHVDMWGDCSCDGFSIGHEAGCQRRIVGKEARVKADAKSRARAADEIAALRARVAVLTKANREAVELIDEINERATSRKFWGISQTIHAKLCTIRITLARAALSNIGSSNDG